MQNMKLESDTSLRGWGGESGWHARGYRSAQPLLLQQHSKLKFQKKKNPIAQYQKIGKDMSQILVTRIDGPHIIMNTIEIQLYTFG